MSKDFNKEKIYRFYSKNKNRVCVVGEFKENRLLFSVSRCSNKDKFVKEKGRLIAEGRLKKGVVYAVIENYKDYNIEDGKLFVDGAKIISNKISKNKGGSNIHLLHNLNKDGSLELVRDLNKISQFKSFIRSFIDKLIY